MNWDGAARKKPLAAAVAAVALAFAVVCPVMAGPGVPEDQGCHGGSGDGGDEAGPGVVCCSSVTAPRLFLPDPGPEAALSFSGETSPPVSHRDRPLAAHSPGGRDPGRLLFLLQASWLI